MLEVVIGVWVWRGRVQSWSRLLAVLQRWVRRVLQAQKKSTGMLGKWLEREGGGCEDITGISYSW